MSCSLRHVLIIVLIFSNHNTTPSLYSLTPQSCFDSESVNKHRNDLIGRDFHSFHSHFRLVRRLLPTDLRVVFKVSPPVANWVEQIDNQAPKVWLGDSSIKYIPSNGEIGKEEMNRFWYVPPRAIVFLSLIWSIPAKSFC